MGLVFHICFSAVEQLERWNDPAGAYPSCISPSPSLEAPEATAEIMEVQMGATFCLSALPAETQISHLSLAHFTPVAPVFLCALGRQYFLLQEKADSQNAPSHLRFWSSFGLGPTLMPQPPWGIFWRYCLTNCPQQTESFWPRNWLSCSAGTKFTTWHWMWTLFYLLPETRAIFSSHGSNTSITAGMMP